MRGEEGEHLAQGVHQPHALPRRQGPAAQRLLDARDHLNKYFLTADKIFFIKSRVGTMLLTCSAYGFMESVQSLEMSLRAMVAASDSSWLVRAEVTIGVT